MNIGQKKTFLGAQIIWLLALLLILVVMAGGPGVHLGLWAPIDGFVLSLKGGFMGGIALAGLSLLVIVIMAVKKTCRGLGKAILALCIGLLLAAPVAYLRLSGGGGVPAIHDITTDLVNPPKFIALVGKRGEGANSLEYDSEKLIPLQKEFYPNIGPIMTSADPQAAFIQARDVAADLGWVILGLDTSEIEFGAGRFEATDYSFWFKFADDIVVVVKETETGSQIDLRSVSRVGVSDLGVNAKRIKSFQDSFSAKP
ncbi:hypothetical protein MNBD_ALPHA03-1843 [hydrothermal vent metagenome]|uniref:DUF1499 domain-containing protein n=1 Tax=hydrothermal vent metagenome TaxID=652676 RepID=A0A3B1B3V8_9ZZZZ